MANQITDNRTVIDAADATTNYDDLAGNASGTQDTDVFIEGSASISFQVTTTRDGLLFDAGATQTAWANSVFYLWVNCGVVGLLDTKANAGFTVRFAGNTVTDWFEFEVGGSDDWPTTVEGGWAQFVVDIEGTPSNTNGTPPATNACRYVGVSGITAAVMTKHQDNTWLDAIWRLGDGNPAVIVEGQNGGSTPWTFADIVTQLGVSSGVVKDGPGGSFVVNGPIQIGINDTTTHEFDDTNQIILFDDQEFAPTDLYSISALGNSGGTTNVTLGVKTGTGDAATGAQGCTFAAASGGVRFDFDFDDPDLDAIGLYGCSFVHGGDFQLDDAAVETIGCLFNDCVSARVDNSRFQRNTIVGAANGDGVAFLTTDDMTDVDVNDFQFSDGHAVELTTPRVATQTSRGNLFTGYGSDGTNDAAIYNNSGGAVSLGITEDGDTPTVRNGASASTTIENFVTLRVEGLSDGAYAQIIAAASEGTVTEGDVLLEGYAQNGIVQRTDFNYEAAFGATLAVIVRARQQGVINAAHADDGGSFTEETDEANSTTSSGDMTLMPADGGQTDDAYYFGYFLDDLEEAHPTKMALDILQAGVGAGPVVDSYSESNQSTSISPVTGEGGQVNAVSQSFQGADGTLHSATFYINTVGSPTGDVFAYLYPVDGVFGGGNDTPNFQPILATSDPVDITTIGGSLALVTFAFPDGYELSSSEDYCIVIGYDGGDSTTNFLQVGVDNSSPSHSGNAAQRVSFFSALSAIDMCFYVNLIPTVAWEYNHVSTDWTALPNVVDGTNGLTKPGKNIISWDDLGATPDTEQINGDTMYWIRARLSSGDFATTQPLGRKAYIDRVRYLPFQQSRLITASGLTVVANWVEDNISDPFSF